MMSRPSSRTSSQRNSACRNRTWVTAAPSCQNVPSRSRRRPMARIFSIISGVSSTSPQASDAIFGQQLLLLQPRDLIAIGWRQRVPFLELLHLLVEAAVLCGQLFKDVLIRGDWSHESDPSAFLAHRVRH